MAFLLDVELSERSEFLQTKGTRLDAEDTFTYVKNFPQVVTETSAVRVCVCSHT